MWITYQDLSHWHLQASTVWYTIHVYACMRGGSATQMVCCGTITACNFAETHMSASSSQSVTGAAVEMHIHLSTCRVNFYYIRRCANTRETRAGCAAQATLSTPPRRHPWTLQWLGLIVRADFHWDMRPSLRWCLCLTMPASTTSLLPAAHTHPATLKVDSRLASLAKLGQVSPIWTLEILEVGDNGIFLSFRPSASTKSFSWVKQHLLVVKQPNVTHNVTTCMGHELQMRTLLKGSQSPLSAKLRGC